MFSFYLKIYRSGIIEFCGSIINIDFNIDSSDGKFTFREYDNGRFKHKTPITKHSNILKGVIVGKKGWGLWIDQWSDGIVDWTFTEKEILDEFNKRNIKIPEPLLIEFQKLIDKKKHKRNLQLLNTRI